MDNAHAGVSYLNICVGLQKIMNGKMHLSIFRLKQI